MNPERNGALWPWILGPGGVSIHASIFHLLGRAEERKRRQNERGLQLLPEQEQLAKIAQTVPVARRKRAHSRRRISFPPPAPSYGQPLPPRPRPRRPPRRSRPSHATAPPTQSSGSTPCAGSSRSRRVSGDSRASSGIPAAQIPPSTSHLSLRCPQTVPGNGDEIKLNFLF